MYVYNLFGLNVQTEFPLCDMPEGDGHPEVFVKAGLLPPQALLPADGGAIHESITSALLYWPEIGSVQVRNGTDITVDPVEGVEQSLLVQIILGVAMGVLLHQRGILTLHASAVVIDEAVVAFLGWKGWGKSTTAASLCSRGHSLITDDILALNLQRDVGAIETIPGIPQFRMWPESAEATLATDPESFPRICSRSPKRVVPHNQASAKRRVPLAAIYLLDYNGSQIPGTFIESVSSRDACVELIRHSYAPRFLGPTDGQPSHLQQCAQLSRQIPVRRLRRPFDLGQLAGIAEAIEYDFSRLMRGTKYPMATTAMS